MRTTGMIWHRGAVSWRGQPESLAHMTAIFTAGAKGAAARPACRN